MHRGGTRRRCELLEGFNNLISRENTRSFSVNGCVRTRTQYLFIVVIFSLIEKKTNYTSVCAKIIRVRELNNVIRRPYWF